MIGKSAGKSFAYLLGVYLGDGCVSEYGNTLYFRVNTIDLEFAEAVRTAIVSLGAKWTNICVHSVKKSTKPNCAYSVRHDDLCRTFIADSEGKQKIPPYVNEWPLENRLAFISGLMDSEGFVAANKSNPTNRRYYMGFKSCDAWVPDFVRILEMTGIRIGKVSQEKPVQAHYKVPTRFTIKMQSWIDAGCRFNIVRKQKRVEDWNEAGAYERRAKFPAKANLRD